MNYRKWYLLRRVLSRCDATDEAEYFDAYSGEWWWGNTLISSTEIPYGFEGPWASAYTGDGTGRMPFVSTGRTRWVG